MTLLHQAAQKAVEAKQREAFEHWYSDAGRWPKSVARGEDGHYLLAQANSSYEAWRAALSALQQQPEPVVTEEAAYQRGKRAGYIDGYRAAHADERQQPDLSPALQHQEVPREPVALNDGVPDAEAAMAYALKRWGYKQGTGACIAFYRGACWLQLAASPSTTRQQEVATWLLYEHEDGHHAVAPTAEAATFAHGDPAWHRVGPVEVSSASRPYRSAAGDTLASIALVELRDANRWPEILSLNTHVLDGAAGPGSKPRAGTLLTLPSPSTTRQQEVGSIVAELVAGLQRAEAKRKQKLSDLPAGTCETCMGEGYLGSIESQRVTDCPDCIGGVRVGAAAPSTPEKAGGVSPENQYFGDLMILQVLADSDCPNDQEREVLLRWIENSQPPGSPIPHPLPAQANDGGPHA